MQLHLLRASWTTTDRRQSIVMMGRGTNCNCCVINTSKEQTDSRSKRRPSRPHSLASPPAKEKPRVGGHGKRHNIKHPRLVALARATRHGRRTASRGGGLYIYPDRLEKISRQPVVIRSYSSVNHQPFSPRWAKSFTIMSLNIRIVCVLIEWYTLLRGVEQDAGGLRRAYRRRDGQGQQHNVTLKE